MKQRTGRLAETWGLELSAMVLFAMLAGTGVVLMFFYRPVETWAWVDVVDMHEVSWAGSLRRLHHWGAQVLLVVVWLHMLRTFLLGAHRPPGRTNWKIGVVLLALTLALATTGYLLPWDRAAVSALELHHPTLGGKTAALEGPATSFGAEGAKGDPDSTGKEKRLLWIYVAHCVFLPAVAIFFVLQSRRLARRATEADP